MGKQGSKASKTPPLCTQNKKIRIPVNSLVRVLGSLFSQEEPVVDQCSHCVATSLNHLMQSLLVSVVQGDVSASPVSLDFVSWCLIHEWLLVVFLVRGGKVRNVLCCLLGDINLPIVDFLGKDIFSCGQLN